MARPQRIKKMSLSKALDKYYATASVHKRGHRQEFYRVNVIQRIPWPEKRWMKSPPWILHLTAMIAWLR